MLNKQVLLEGQRIYLRILTVNDASEKYCSWINDSDVNKFLESKKITIEELQEYIENKYNNLNCIFLGIFLKNNNVHIGNVKLEPIDFKEKKATLGILIGEKNCWGKGYATEALKMLISYSFNKINLKEIDLGVKKKNVGALKSYNKAGFEIYEETEEVYKMKIVRSR
ncbi:hypothetical protein LCGC14_0712380 [marine sediment metagenome]|uniref:N-acetyltransferase domain-containing protein n=1 Tax=marine sediment metagenome TaxID=412755 RepID=A0A0F9QEN3_9ZZZZ